ncbi:serine/threonine protein kinase [Ruminococcus sp.]|uniref:serine/threonine protein kinase n=1 Tax=Ruminococcus sp. TaxID=41978 RepID=UPI0025D1242D|nr:serine/threonine protein kinase [Ruminococcus sp.]MBQ8967495.1 serine/threonine protein kinase [Ruminococcus sp.]
MITQTINGIKFKMASYHDLSFLEDYGEVFKVFDDQDSGNICFGVDSPEGRLFIKYAGAPTAEYSGAPADAIMRLKASAEIYHKLSHPALIRFREARSMGTGYGLVFDWAEGECMGRMYEDSHRKIMALPVTEKLGIFAAVTDFLKHTAATGFTAVDFYDGSIMYDPVSRKTTICDIDFFRPQPTVNDMGRMWGSSRFMSPEEYEKGAQLDEMTNVFTLGQTGFSIFTDSSYDPAAFPLGKGCYDVLMKAVSPEREKRFGSIAEFEAAWKNEIQRR